MLARAVLRRAMLAHAVLLQWWAWLPPAAAGQRLLLLRTGVAKVSLAGRLLLLSLLLLLWLLELVVLLWVG